MKYIVSHHSGSILAMEEPQTPFDAELDRKGREAFSKVLLKRIKERNSLNTTINSANSNNNSSNKKGAQPAAPAPTSIPQEADDNTETLEIDHLAEVLIETGFHYDKALLQPNALKFYKSNEMISLESYLSFLQKYKAPEYYYGQRFRRNCGRGLVDEVLSLLMRNCSPNTADGEGLTALHYCCEFNQVKVMELLFRIYDDQEASKSEKKAHSSRRLLVNLQDKYGWTPLYCAAHFGNQNCVQILLANGADPSIPNIQGKIPLHAAITRNKKAICELLMRAGSSLNSIDNKGMTVLHDCAYRGFFELYEAMKYEKSDLVDLSIKDQTEYSADDYAQEFPTVSY